VATPPTAEELVAISYIQRALAHGGALIAIPTLNVQVGGAGLRVASSDTHKPALQWQVEDLKKQLAEVADNAIEELLDYMTRNAPSFPIWTASDSYTQLTSRIIDRASRMAPHLPFPLTQSIFKRFHAAIGHVEDTKVKPLLCADLYQHILTLINSDGATVYELQLIAFLKSAISRLAAAKGILSLYALIDTQGVSTLANNNSYTMNVRQPLNPAISTQIANLLQVEGEQYLNQARQLLYQFPDEFPLWRDSACKQATEIQSVNTPTSSFFMV
jgi:hypothetical protein